MSCTSSMKYIFTCGKNKINFYAFYSMKFHVNEIFLFISLAPISLFIVYDSSRLLLTANVQKLVAREGTSHLQSMSFINLNIVTSNFIRIISNSSNSNTRFVFKTHCTIPVTPQSVNPIEDLFVKHQNQPLKSNYLPVANSGYFQSDE